MMYRIFERASGRRGNGAGEGGEDCLLLEPDGHVDRTVGGMRQGYVAQREFVGLQERLQVDVAAPEEVVCAADVVVIDLHVHGLGDEGAELPLILPKLRWARQYQPSSTTSPGEGVVARADSTRARGRREERRTWSQTGSRVFLIMRVRNRLRV